MTVKIIYLNGAFEFMRDVKEIKKNECSFIIVQRNGYKRELDQRLTLEVKFYQDICMCTDNYHTEIESGDIVSLLFNNSVYIGMVENISRWIYFCYSLGKFLGYDRHNKSTHKNRQKIWMFLQYCCEKGRFDSRISKLKSRTFKRSVKTIQNNFIQRFMYSAP